MTRHVVTAPHKIPFSGTWVAFCTCGREFQGTSADEVRDAGQECRQAERERLRIEVSE